MNPQNTQSQNPLDPSVVNLVKALGKSESGGSYTATGKDGEQGAYQMTSAFIQNNAPKYLKDYNPQIPLTPTQQDELAYNVVKDWGTKGNPAYSYMGKLNPAQIASAWNAGDPNAYLDPEGHTGISKGGASYDTLGYVNKVKQNYEQLSGVQQEQDNSSIPITQTSNGQDQQTQQGNLNLSPLEQSIADSYRKADPNITDEQLLKELRPDWGLGDILGGLEMAAPGLGGIVSGIAPKIAGLVGSATSFISKGLGAKEAIDLATGGNANNQQSNQSQPSGNNGLLGNLGTQLPEVQQASATLAKTLLDSLRTTATGSNLANDPNTQGAITTIGKYGFAPNIDENGRMDFTDAYNNKSKKALDQLSNGVEQVLDTEGKIAPLEYAKSQAKNWVREHAPSSEWASADSEIEKEAETYNKNFGQNGSLKLSTFQKMKQEQWHGKKFNVMDSNAKRIGQKALGYGARQTITDHTDHKDFYNASMKEEQNIINGRNVMKRLNGKKAPRNEGVLKELMHAGGKYAALYIGDKIGGPMGAILGMMAGRKIEKMVDKRFGSNTFETPAMKKALFILKQGSPDMYKVLVNKLKQEDVSVPQEDEKTRESLDTVKEVKHEVADLRNPKGGEFSYSTNGVSRNPKQKKGLLSQALKEKALKAQTQ